MADRVFAGLMLAVTLIYGWLAFTAIQAPFQYDPLGPESWPRLLSIVAALCLTAILLRPDVPTMNVARTTWVKIGLMVVLLVAYAELFQRLGFVLSTLAFGALSARLLGASWKNSILFGLIAGIAGYLICAGLLGLNLPAGPLPRL
ncbi:tripartite tricarboxylate transporter TctB family protein [Rhodobacter sp. NSM]|uniref:tripartite tricarboxylate transporter TctB family protein n=1 Tax=Rhodobacter sp. NSM TaxID=3457501 RepID=UPI003FD1FC26